MQQLIYVIRDSLGIHARPAGMLAKLAKSFENTVITIECGNRSAKATQLIKLMGLGAKQGDEITVTIDGPNESEAVSAMQHFFSEYL
jgi:phosphocarrier protein